MPKISKCICVVQNLATATTFDVDLNGKIPFNPDYMIVRSVTLDPNAAPLRALVWCDLTGDVIFSIGAEANVIRSMALEQSYPVGRPVGTLRFQVRDIAGAVLNTIAGAALIFHLEFVKDS